MTDKMQKTRESVPVKASGTLSDLESCVERLTHENVSDLRGQTLSQLRRKFEQRAGNPTRFVSLFPMIGRGNVLRDKVLDHATINQTIDALLARSI